MSVHPKIYNFVTKVEKWGHMDIFLVSIYISSDVLDMQTIKIYIIIIIITTTISKRHYKPLSRLDIPSLIVLIANFVIFMITLQ